MKISYSMRQAMKQCPRKVFWKYYAGIEPKIEYGISKTIGTSFHLGLETLRKTKDLDAAIFEARKDLRENVNDEIMLIENLAKIEVYLFSYDEKFFDSSKEWYAVEMEVETDDEIAYIDGIIKDDHDGLIIVEDKTRTILGKHNDKAQKLSDQLLNYCDLVRTVGLDIRKCLYRETQKSKLKLNSKVTELNIRKRLFEEYQLGDKLQETEIVFSKKEIDDYAEEKKFFAKYIDMCVQLNDINMWPRHSDNCVNIYGACEYLHLCSKQKQAIDLYKMNEKDPLDDGLTRKKLGLL